MNKKIRAAKYVDENSGLFICPVCGGSVHVKEFKSLVCTNNHSFDFAKQGYLNLLTKPPKSKYDKSLFSARRKLMQEVGFFDPVVEYITESIQNQFERESSLTLLDTGSGEGTHLSKICELLKDESRSITGVGIDIAKEGILASAKEYDSQIWCVADLANLPFSNHQFDVILNILSPSNYQEFIRLLKPNGVLIKIIPGKSYLKELREAFYEDREKKTYSNDDVISLFKDSFSLIHSENIYYTKTLDRDSLEALVKMTPLSWSSSNEKVESFLQRGEKEITIDLEVLIGIKKD